MRKLFASVAVFIGVSATTVGIAAAGTTWA
jgi:hypothetical protein